jgi:membrane-associated protease RseP (regulator of RpoE activity)
VVERTPVLQLTQPGINDILPTLSIILGAWAVIYIIGRLRLIRSSRLKIYPLAILYRIEGVERWLDRLLVKPGLIRTFSDISIILGFVLMLYVIWFLTNNLINFFKLSPEFARLTLLIPGVTVISPRILPYVLIALPVILVSHEMMHGLVARAERLRIKSGGVGVALLFILGFVEPDEEGFKAARPRVKARILAAGSGANILVLLLLSPLLLGTPTLVGAPPFPLLLPEPVRDAFYEPGGALILSLDPSRGVGLAGGRVGDIILSIQGVEVRRDTDLRRVSLTPGEQVTLRILRGDHELELPVTVEPSPDDPRRGLLYILPSTHFQPRFYTIPLPTEVHNALFWVWLLSWAVGLFNMLPMKPLDGHGLLASTLEALVRSPTRERLLWAVSAGCIALLAGNIIASYSQGFFIL